MIELIAKDVRLGCDALINWSIGVALAALGLILLPIAFPNTFWLGPQSRPFDGVIEILGTALIFLITPTAAWITLAVWMGERRHHATSMAAVLPIAWWKRGLAKAVAIAVACTVPLLLTLLLTIWWSASSSSVSPLRPPPQYLSLWTLISQVFVGCGLAGAAAPFARGILDGLGRALLIALACGLAGLGGAILNVAWQRLAQEFVVTNQASEDLFAISIPIGVPVAVKVGAIGALAYGLLIEVVPAARRRWPVACGAILLLALLASVDAANSATFLIEEVSQGRFWR
ncbi:MAG: hypothetical protein JNL80_09580 [Phycisphaerae bacterium]|jgi:hypothetical protein|nr:hypothetical protein [Phycisphaerae bacterium]